MPKLIVVALIEEAGLDSYVQFFQAGADGYFVMPGTPRSLEQMLDDALSGWKPFSREIQKAVTERLTRTSVLAHPNGALTAAERTVVSHMSLDLSDKEIAVLTGTATATIHSTANRIYKKLGVHTRRDAVSIYLGFGRQPRPNGI